MFKALSEGVLVGAFDYYETEWKWETLTDYEQQFLVTAWESLDACDADWFEDFDEFCEEFIQAYCYPED